MPIMTTYQLENVTMEVGKDKVPVVDEGTTEPRWVERTVMVFIDGHTQTRVMIPLSDDGRQVLIRLLTGGIVIPDPAAPVPAPARG